MEQILNILLVSPLPPPSGGIATWTKMYLEHPFSLDNKVDILNIAVSSSRANQLHKRKLFDEFKRTSSIISEGKNMVSSKQYDIIHINNSCTLGGMLRDILLLKRIKRDSKVVLHLRCSVEYTLASNIKRKVFARLIKLADSIIVLNSKSKEFIEQNFKYEAQIIPNFINEKQYTKKYTVSNSVKSIIFVGHVTYKKGANYILEVAEKFPLIKFKLVGYISDEINNLRKPENVEYLGEISKEEVINNMYNSDMFLFPSLTEGFANALCEAMAVGLPCIVSDVGANKDMIENNGGIVLRQINTHEIYESITKLEEKQVRINCSQWNKEKVLSCYTIDAVMNVYYSLYRKLLGDK